MGQSIRRDGLAGGPLGETKGEDTSSPFSYAAPIEPTVMICCKPSARMRPRNRDHPSRTQEQAPGGPGDAGGASEMSGKGGRDRMKAFRPIRTSRVVASCFTVLFASIGRQNGRGRQGRNQSAGSTAATGTLRNEVATTVRSLAPCSRTRHTRYRRFRALEKRG